MSYIGTKLLAFDGRLYLFPSYAAVGGAEERTRLAAGPYIRSVTCVAEQWMIRAQSVLPTLAAVQ
jgi:hypothetical protein